MSRWQTALLRTLRVAAPVATLAIAVTGAVLFGTFSCGGYVWHSDLFWALLLPCLMFATLLLEARLPLSAWMFPGTHDEFMQCLGNLPLASQPGERWLYHMSAEILGVLIARVSGMALSVFMHERIFEPLGMATARREARRASVFPFFGSRVIST